MNLLKDGLNSPDPSTNRSVPLCFLKQNEPFHPPGCLSPSFRRGSEAAFRFLDAIVVLVSLCTSYIVYRHCTYGGLTCCLALAYHNPTYWLAIYSNRYRCLKFWGLNILYTVALSSSLSLLFISTVLTRRAHTCTTTVKSRFVRFIYFCPSRLFRHLK